MKHRHLLLLTASAVPLAVELAHAQPRLKDRVNPSAATGDRAVPVGGAPATAPAATPPPPRRRPRCTPRRGRVPAAGALGAGGPPAPGGKSQGDTNTLPQFESGVEFDPRSPNYNVAFSLEDADLPELVRVIAQLTGKRFIFGGKVPQHQGDRLLAAEGHRRRGVPGVPLDPRDQRPHGRAARTLPQDRRDGRRRHADDAHLRQRAPRPPTRTAT